MSSEAAIPIILSQLRYDEINLSHFQTTLASYVIERKHVNKWWPQYGEHSQVDINHRQDCLPISQSTDKTDTHLTTLRLPYFDQ